MTDENDVDGRIEQALRSRAAQAPRAHDLAGDLAATARHRVRRRRNATMTVAAVLVAVVAFGGVWSLTGPDSFTAVSGNDSAGSGDRAAAPEGDQATAPTQRGDPDQGGWRWESYGGVEVSVPAGWTYGISDSPWCVDDRGLPSGEVGRPGPVRAILCPGTAPADRLGEHVWLTEAGQSRPGTENLAEGWIRDTVVVGGVRIEVLTHASPAVREHILESVRQVSTDTNGCTADHQVSGYRLVRPTNGLDWNESTVTGLSICKYRIGAGTGHPLIASVRLDAAGAANLLRAIAAAPGGSGPDDPSGAPNHLGDEATVLRFATADGIGEVFLRYSGSRHNGFDNGSGMRSMTRESVAFMTGPLTVSGGPGVTMDLLPRPR